MVPLERIQRHPVTAPVPLGLPMLIVVFNAPRIRVANGGVST